MKKQLIFLVITAIIIVSGISVFQLDGGYWTAIWRLIWLVASFMLINTSLAYSRANSDNLIYQLTAGVMAIVMFAGCAIRLLEFIIGIFFQIESLFSENGRLIFSYPALLAGVILLIYAVLLFNIPAKAKAT